MIPQSLAEIAAAVSGDVIDADPAQSPLVLAGAFVDSRAPLPRGLFVAVPGEHVDGHEFAAAAVKEGAAAALVQHPVGAPAVRVDDTVVALGRLARHLVGLVPELTVVGITGSQGKTSTKDILAQLLERRGVTVAPTGSFNTEIGLPLTVSRIDASTRYLVSELGARGSGHIRYLTELAPPRIGVVLNVGVAHIGEFGSREAIAAAKAELIEALPPDGVAVLNADDPLVFAMRHRTSARILTVGHARSADVRISRVELDDGGRPSFELATAADTAPVHLQLVGEHQAGNAAAAAGVALVLGEPLNEVAAALGNVRPRSRWRMDVATASADVTVINDAYNANPDSMRAALRTLVSVANRRRPPARTVAVLGEMLELGDTTEAEHVALGQLIAGLEVDVLVPVGASAMDIVRGATASASWRGRTVLADTPEDASKLVSDLVQPGDVVLVKASRAAGLETVASALLQGCEGIA